MQATKALDILRDILASISEDKRIQVLLISWCFGGFLEAAAGYGTAVAIPIGILIALGFNPLKAAIASKYRSDRIWRGWDPGFYSGRAG